MNRIDRRALLAATLASFAFAIPLGCKKEERCKNCGMRIDPTSPWRTELVLDDGSVAQFDTPRCAFQSWRSGKTSAKTLRAQDYYDRQMRDAGSLRFVVGGDVIGPMGPDLVPVDPARASKFIQDHGADRALRLEEVTTAVLANIQ
jgi:nitrous oxide reductase accessory protein NosL